jgi:ABC-2 type transport system permease protein
VSRQPGRPGTGTSGTGTSEPETSEPGTSSWWRGTWLVAERGILESIRSRSFKIVTALLLAASLGAVVVPALIDSGRTTYTLATVGAAPAELVRAIDAAAVQGGFTARYLSRSGDVSVREAVKAGDAAVGLAGDTLYVTSRGAGQFPVVVAQTAVTLARTHWLTDAGLSASQLAQLQAIQPPHEVTVGQVKDERRAGVGFAAGIVLYLALTFAGSAIATTVGTEKSSRISEVLLATLRPSQSLVGTVVAAGAITLFQVLVLAVPIAVSGAAGGRYAIPSGVTGDLTLAVVWFLLGFWMYSFLFAASASLVDKITEVSSAIMPVTTLLIGVYLASVIVVTQNPGAPWSVLISLFPLSAPIAMPIRWASGEVPLYQLVTAMVLTAAAAWLMALTASTLYRRGLLVTGHRVRLREALGSRRPTPPRRRRSPPASP